MVAQHEREPDAEHPLGAVHCDRPALITKHLLPSSGWCGERTETCQAHQGIGWRVGERPAIGLAPSVVPLKL